MQTNTQASASVFFGVSASSLNWRLMETLILLLFASKEIQTVFLTQFLTLSLTLSIRFD